MKPIIYMIFITIFLTGKSYCQITTSKINPVEKKLNINKKVNPSTVNTPDSSHPNFVFDKQIDTKLNNKNISSNSNTHTNTHIIKTRNNSKKHQNDEKTTTHNTTNNITSSNYNNNSDEKPQKHKSSKKTKRCGTPKCPKSYKSNPNQKLTTPTKKNMIINTLMGIAAAGIFYQLAQK